MRPEHDLDMARGACVAQLESFPRVGDGDSVCPTALCRTQRKVQSSIQSEHLSDCTGKSAGATGQTELLPNRRLLVDVLLRFQAL